MPEGDSIYQDATRLRPELVGRTIRAADARDARIVRGLEGQDVLQIRTHGKHLLLHLETVVLRVHLRMKGRWKILRPEARPLWDGLGVYLATDRSTCACFWGEVERIDPRALDTHPLLASLGPDLLSPPIDFDDILRRARRHADRPIQDTLLDQQVAAGIGNVYKSELLFAERLCPTQPTAEVSDAKLHALYERAARWLWANRDTRRRTTTGHPARPLYVYGGRKSCARCKGWLSADRQGEHHRITWWCPTCQA